MIESLQSLTSESSTACTSRRTIHKPQLTQEQMEGFSLLSHQKSATAIINRLTGSQFRLWHYLIRLDPFADQSDDGERIYRNIPSPIEIGIAIGSSPRTVEKDMNRLETLGLYAKRITGWQGYNLTAEDGRKVSDSMKAAKAERAAQTPVKSPKPSQHKDGYLAANPAISPPSRLNSRKSGEIAEPETLETQSGKEIQAPAISPHTIQTYLDPTDNNIAVDLNEIEVIEEANRQTESTGILEEPRPDPITEAQQVTVQLLDKREIFNELRRMDIETNETVRATIKKFEANVLNAIAHIKQRYDKREKFRNITGAFVKACREAAKPDQSQGSWGLHAEVNPPSSEQQAALEKAKFEGKIKDHFVSSFDNICKIVLVDGRTQIPWWEWFKE